MVRKSSKKLPKSVRVEEFPALIKKTKSTHHKSAFLLAYGAGLRISEVLRFDPSEHYRGNSIFIPESKYGVERIVPIPKGWNKEKQGKIFPLNISARALQVAFKKAAKKANLNPKYTFHSLRHGFATRCIESGIPINQVQVLLGHSNIATTNVYVRANPADALKNYEELF